MLVETCKKCNGSRTYRTDHRLFGWVTLPCPKCHGMGFSYLFRKDKRNGAN